MLRSLVKTAQIVIKKKGAASGLWADRRQVVGLGNENRIDRLQKFREKCTHEHSRRE